MPAPTTAIPHPADRPALPIPEAGAYLGLGRVSSYNAANSGYLPTIRTSAHRRVVPTAELWKMLGLDPATGRIEANPHEATQQRAS